MATMKKKLGELLLNLRLVTQQHLDQALEIQRESARPLGAILISLGFINEDQLLNALAAQDGVSPWRLDEKPPTAEAVGLVPGHICRSFQLVPITLRGDLLVLGMRNPLDLDAIDLVRNLTGKRIETVLVDETRLQYALDQPSLGKTEREAQAGKMDGLVVNALNEFQAKKGGPTKNILTEEDTRPVVGLVNQILSDAIRMGASDVHIEPRAEKVDIRYRVDGHLQKIRDIPLSLHPMLTTRLKIMAEMDIVEFRVPLDGRVSARVDDRDIDLRVSTIPNQHGQRIVLRVLDKSRSLKKLDELGFSKPNLEIFRSLIRRPHGVFLVTGPTGSGKTTTLYAALQEIKDVRLNVMTCEDPIEYEIEGINQSMVHEKVGLTFAAQLRAMLRQDPDVILVGEIRDRETAETAVRAALTGHLVLSTLHCNDAVSAVPRLIDMGIDPFLLSTTLIGTMSQRLVRKSCQVCHGTVGGSVCSNCRGQGFKGRMAVHEILPIHSDVASAIGQRAPMAELVDAARLAGYRPMEFWARELISQGLTTEEEARRQIFFASEVEKSVAVQDYSFNRAA